MGYKFFESRCLCDPDKSKEKHMCIYRSTFWVKDPGLIWKRMSNVRSAAMANNFLYICENWSDVLLFKKDLGLED